MRPAPEIKPVPEQLRESAARRYLTSDLSYKEVAEEFGVGKTSVRDWVQRAKRRGDVAKKPADTSDDRSPAEKFRLVLEASKLSDEELGEFLRREGLRDGDLERWAEEAQEGLSGTIHNESDRRRIRDLERQQRKLEKQLREAKALLELQKKVAALWEAADDDTPQG